MLQITILNKIDSDAVPMKDLPYTQSVTIAPRIPESIRYFEFINFNRRSSNFTGGSVMIKTNAFEDSTKDLPEITEDEFPELFSLVAQAIRQHESGQTELWP